jgi:hypothetical protein
LQVLKAVRYSRLADPNPKFPLLIKKDIAVGIPQLAKMGGAGTGWGVRKIRLQKHVEMFGNITKDDKAGTPNEE